MWLFLFLATFFIISIIVLGESELRRSVLPSPGEEHFYVLTEAS